LTLDTSMSAVFTFRDGRIAQARFFLHRTDAMEAAGG
jgi:ketosteroid isomerase-like protein